MGGAANRKEGDKGARVAVIGQSDRIPARAVKNIVDTLGNGAVLLGVNDVYHRFDSLLFQLDL